MLACEMGCRGRPFFDLNESPADDDEENDDTFHFQPQKSFPSSSPLTSDLFPVPESCQRMVDNHVFSLASPVSGVQPFARSKDVNDSQGHFSQRADDSISNLAASSTTVSFTGESKVTLSVTAGATDAQAIEREEGEWSDVEGTSEDICKKQHDGTFTDCAETSVKPGPGKRTDLVDLGRDSENTSTDAGPTGSTKDEVMCGMKDENSHVSLWSEQESFEHSHNNSKHSDGNSKGQVSLDSLEESSLVLKQKDVKGFEAMHALKLGNSPLKRQKVDQHKEAMLGKKRSRQTVFLNIDHVKQAGPMKTLTPRRQTFSSPVATHTMKEIHTIVPAPERTEERQGQLVDRDQKQASKLIMERNASMEFADHKPESNGDVSQGSQAQSVKPNNGSDSPAEVCPPPVPRQGLCKQSIEMRQPKNPQVSARKPVLTNQIRESFDAKAANKKHPPSKKQSANSPQCLDTSVERLLREVTSEKFWHQPGETDLQCVPGEFESVVEYVRVFEPLLFEECRAQLYSSWEELTETVLRDAHMMVRIKAVERRERGWYDVIVLPAHECKWVFKEGNVAILSTPRPGAARSRRSNNPAAAEDDAAAELAGRVAGTIRRYIPIDTRDPPGAILHFYVGDANDLSSFDGNHVLKKFQPKSIWYLTVLGSLATTQREYIALHAFRHLSLQMQTAILKPSPEHFPKYEQPPAMPDCFTQNFVEHLHRTFNGPQLSAIQWAAMHTAAGTNSSGMTKRQDPWPFTLVQGPPGTGKTHTVWGMLNVIHLVRYQHYYTALLKKLAPESYRQANESSPEGVSSGSIDEVLQNMDQNLFRTLPKLCPKPRMLVCAPSNAATDELLARVLDRGFIDGEMKIYRPDVARVGVDSQSRAAQAVSVERRTEQLLAKGCEEIIGWMHQLRVREAQFSQQITSLQRELFAAAAAAAVHSQGSVSVNPDILIARDHNRDVLLQNLAAVVEGRDKLLVEISRLLILESRFRPSCNFNLEEARAKLEASFANEAEIVFTTVSSSGRKLFCRLTHGFDMVVIDEAAQASEVAVLPPLSLGAARCVLVGDPQQLPATVISKAAGTLLYSRSLFERFQQAGCPTMLLSVQYRMHPQIRDFPSMYFYQGRLTDSESVSNLADELYYKDPLLRPYMFYDLTHGRESHRGGSVSYQNIHEAKFSRRLYDHLQKTLKSLGGIKVSVGIITPYKLQLKCLHREFEEVLDSEEGKDLYINTVDAFQGQERDVIIMSCVRASNHGVGFVADIRRMNVALTRARRALWVVGNANALVQSDDWAALIVDAKARNCFRDTDSIPKDFLVPKGPASYTPLPGKASSYMRGMRMNEPLHRTLDVIPGSKFGGQSVEEEGPYCWAPPKNGSYGRIFKAHVENLEQSGSKRQNSAGICKRHS